MLRYPARAISLVVLAALLWPPHSSHAETLDRIAAVVDDKVFTFNDIRKEGQMIWIDRGFTIDLLDRVDNEQREALLKQLLDNLIDMQVAANFAKRKRTKVEDWQLDRQLESIDRAFRSAPPPQNTTLEDRLKQRNVRMDEYRTFVRRQILAAIAVRGELDRKVTLTEEDLNACARKSAPEGPSRRSFTLSRIIIRLARDNDQGAPKEPSVHAAMRVGFLEAIDIARYSLAGLIYERIANGEASFEDMAKQFSAGAEAPQGGQLSSSYAPGDLAKELNVVFEQPVGGITPPIENPVGFVIFRVDAIDEQKSGRWQQAYNTCQMQLQAIERQKLEKSWFKDQRTRSFIDIRAFDDLSP